MRVLLTIIPSPLSLSLKVIGSHNFTVSLGHLALLGQLLHSTPHLCSQLIQSAGKHSYSAHSYLVINIPTVIMIDCF